MSGTQSTIADRFNKKATRTGSILSKDHPPDKKPKSDKPAAPTSHEFDPTGLVQRCVIIQKDENGFGLTVSGDNPVFVQLVKEDGAAMRAGVQTGDRIIKVNGTLVTHSNHVEVVKLIKSGSYVALTVLGRPPGLAHIPLPEAEEEGGPPLSSLTSPHSPGPTPTERSSSTSTSPSDRISSSLPVWEDNNVMLHQKVDILQKMLTKEHQDPQAMKEEYIRNLHQGESGSDGSWTNNTASPVTPGPLTAPLESPCQRDTPCHSPKTTPRDSLNSCPSPDAEETPELDSNSQSGVGTPLSRPAPQIIGAEDDDFDTEQEQVNGQCSCFQSMELLKSRPAHLAAFLHHVVSQFDPAPLLCYLYAELYKHTNSKETRRIFMDFHTFFLDRAANLKVSVPESISAELDRRRPELITEDVQRQYVQQVQDTLLSDIQKNLEDFRQKRSMGLTLAEADLARLDSERMRDRVALERERSCAEHIISKIEDVLLTSQPTEEEKCTTMQYVIVSYMKHLGVKVKESRGLEPKPKRMMFLPKIKKSIKPEKDGGGEEKVKKPRFPSILGPPRRPSKIDAPSIGKAMELNRQRPQKQMSQSALGAAEQVDSTSGRVRGSQSSEGSDGTAAFTASPPYSAPATQDSSNRDSDSGGTPSSALPRLSDGASDALDSSSHGSGTHFDFSPCTLEHLQEEELENDRNLDGGTPRPVRRMDPLSSAEVQSEDDQGNEDSEQDPLNWQTLVSRDILSGLTPQEIKRQEVINELFYTERAHLRMLKVLDNVFYQKLTRDSILPPADIKNIFTNLEEIVQLHVSITEQMAAIRKKNENSVIDSIGDDLLSWFGGAEEEKIKQAVGTFCSNQPFALELIKSRQKKDQRFISFMQEAESNRLCRRLQLKDMIPVEMQRLTKYPLLLESIAKYTEDAAERSKVKRAGECCRKILNHVNQEVREAENKQRLEDYQRRLDLSSLKQSENPMIAEFKNLDLTKRKMVHEGPLSWKVNKDKTIELYTLLLEDILVLLQRQDERLILKCHSKNLAGTADTKHIFSPIIKLNTVLVRSVATDNKSFFVLSMSDNGAQIYELMAQTVSEQKTWQCLITEMADAMKTKQPNIIPLPQNDGEREADEVEKLNKDSDRISTGSTQSPEKELGSRSEILQTQPASTNPFDTKSEDEEEEDGLEADLAERLADLPERSRQVIALDEEDADVFGLPPSKAEEALQTLAALRQLLIKHMAAQEEAARGEPVGGEEKRSGSLPGPGETGGPGDSADNVSDKTETGRAKTEPPAELPPSDTGFFETTEDYAATYMLLEGCGGAGESSTDDDLLAGDSDIDLKKLLSSSSSSQSGSGPDLSRQIMTHIRLLQANLQELKETEIKYNQLRQRLAEEAATDTEERKDKS
ncbi:rho guanine nucleotide exchange factor 12 [Chanos chanos]|uniref:Rho guanine nucleotide exchange factor 12 n=1 Tax=Chanos chanos TaxID=29144 RepID=A0A6J2WVP5_CHACN|nr:rho guanine nucleotide exchange factor 12-like [Chanos chanos]